MTLSLAYRADASSGVLALDSIDTEVTLKTLVAGFVPTPRFAGVSLENYHPNPGVPSQHDARERLRRFATEINDPANGHLGSLLSRLLAHVPNGPPGIYLDGGYGVGKTHLLAAVYHLARVPKLYLSFSELAFTIVQMGLPSCVAEFRQYPLICLDEFELDDVANTRMAASFLRGVMEAPGGTRVVTTSNTLPSESGRGRFAAQDFAREIGEISARFDVISIGGEDYRRRSHRTTDLEAAMPTSATLHDRFLADRPARGGKVFTTHQDLLAHLAGLHPIRYARLLDSIGAIFIDGLAPILDQDQALRFVHFVDKVYDMRVSLTASTNCPLHEIFAAEYRDKGYAKKYRRCLSRLHELIEETTGAA